MSYGICEYCGCSAGEHDYEQLARHCYPIRLEHLNAAYAELREAAEDVLQAWDNDCPGFDVMNKLRAALDKLTQEVGS